MEHPPHIVLALRTPTRGAARNIVRNIPMSSPYPSPRRRPVSQNRYLVRRLGALVLLASVLIVVISGGRWLLGGDPTGAAAPASTGMGESTTSVSSATSGSAAPVATAAIGETTVAPVTVPAGPPTAESPAVMLIAGDSDAGTFGPYLEQLMDETGVVRTQLDYKVSSGLARPDFFDWPAHFRTMIPSVDPDIVVVTFGGNDSQGLSIADGTFITQTPDGTDADAEWREEYGRRVGEVMDLLRADGRTLVWVGIPNDDNDDVTTRLRVQDEVVRAEVAKRPDVRFVDTWKRFAGLEGGWAEYVVDPRDGQGKDVRADDGFHLNVVGAEILALDIAEAVKAALRERGAAL